MPFTPGNTDPCKMTIPYQPTKGARVNVRFAKLTLAVHSRRVHAGVCGVCLRRLSAAFNVTLFYEKFPRNTLLTVVTI